MCTTAVIRENEVGMNETPPNSDSDKERSEKHSHFSARLGDNDIEPILKVKKSCS